MVDPKQTPPILAIKPIMLRKTTVYPENDNEDLNKNKQMKKEEERWFRLLTIGIIASCRTGLPESIMVTGPRHPVGAGKAQELTHRRPDQQTKGHFQ